MSVLTKCVICEENKEKGIHVIHAFICCECEKEIVTTDTSEPAYNTFIEKLRIINSVKEEIVN
ncbi:sigma factor G inhibitor Gin [Bacillus sp. EAC]|uniref:sigma factor G inhibitor Gin n=1 Tax=Bacillus sp. EAC TaxID=1978338 RepID=UPI00211AF2A4|nr:sigma factor G inhibitor Gin [Bacillus sp. EAC]